jgi:hypothetical protein
MQAARRKMIALEVLNPKNGVVAEIEIPVIKRGLEGILADVDALEDRSRTIPVSAARSCLPGAVAYSLCC